MGQGPVEAKYGPVGWKEFRPITPYNCSIPLGFHKQVKSRCVLMSSSRATGWIQRQPRFINSKISMYNLISHFKYCEII